MFIFVLTLVAIFRRWWFPPRDQGFEKADGATGALVRKYLASADLEGSEKEPLKARSKRKKRRSQVSWPTIGAPQNE